jgi:hypothetical protein
LRGNCQNWTTPTEVARYALVKWDSLNTSPNNPFGSENAFNDFLAEVLIPRAQGHINKFCKRDFDVDFPGAIPPAVGDVAARATANMLQYMVMNKMGPLIHQGEFKITLPEVAALTAEEELLLEPWIKRRPYTTATPYRSDKIASDWTEPTPDQ